MGACCSPENRESLAQQFQRFQQQQSNQSHTQQNYDGGLVPIQQQPPQQKNQGLLFAAAQSSNNQPLPLQQFDLQQLQSLTPQQQQQLFLQHQQHQQSHQYQQQQLLIQQQQQVQQLQIQQQQQPQSIQKFVDQNTPSQVQSPQSHQQQQHYEEELERERQKVKEKEQELQNLQQMLKLQETLQQRQSHGTPASAIQSPSQDLPQQTKTYKIMSKAQEIVDSYEKARKGSGGLRQQSIQSDNQLREEYRLFEGHYIQEDEDTKKDVKLFLKIDTDTQTVVGHYHDKTLEYDVQGFIDTQSKQILIGLFKRPLLIIVGQYNNNFHKIQGYTLDQNIIEDADDWHETTLLLKNA